MDQKFKKILVAEDASLMQKIILGFLNEIGKFQITFADDGEIAWKILNTPGNEFDLVISDWTMPNLTGIELLSLIQKSNLKEKFKFILVTAEGEKEQISLGKKLGAHGHIVKPFNKSDLENILRGL